MPIAVIMVLLCVIGGLLVFGWPLVQSVGSVVWGVQNENILTAIPLFILLGELLLRSGIADKMYGALSLWFGRLPGGPAAHQYRQLCPCSPRHRVHRSQPPRRSARWRCRRWTTGTIRNGRRWDRSPPAARLAF